jgi:hypothetical protein
MLFAAAVLLTVGAIVYTLLVRDKDVPQPEAVTGWEHLEQRKARIYDNLRDLQFEYRVGKLSEADYTATKLTLQAELAGVMAELDRVKGSSPPPAPVKKPEGATVCPHCGAKFPIALKFCGACGKEMV